MKHVYFLLLIFFGWQSTLAQVANPLVYIETSKENEPTFTFVPPGLNIAAYGFTRGFGINYADPIAPLEYNYFTSKSWNAVDEQDAIDNEDYIEWEVSTDENFYLDIKEVNLALRRSALGPTHFNLHYSFDDFTTSNSIGTEELENTTTTPFIIPTNITSPEGAMIVFRLYAWGATDAEAKLEIAANSAWTGTSSFSRVGFRLLGFLKFEGLEFTSSGWTPFAPNESTGDLSALVSTGNWIINSNVHVKSVEVTSNGSITLNPTGNLRVSGNFRTEPGKVTLNSTSTRFSSLIVEGESQGSLKYVRYAKQQPNNDLLATPFTGESWRTFIKLSTNRGNIRNKNSVYLFGPFDKATNNYTNYTSTANATLKHGIGYRVGTIASPGANITFTGTMITSPLDVPIAHNLASGGWNLIGNPYPSYLDMEQFLLENQSKLDPEALGIYGWKGTAPNAWEIYNLGTIGVEDNPVIAPGQGFMVAAAAGTAPSIRFTPEMRIFSTADDFIAGRKANQENSGYIKVNLSNNDFQYETKVYFLNNTTAGLDAGYDSGVFQEKAPAFSVYSHLVEDNNGLELGIQSLPFPEDGKSITIPLGVNAEAGRQLSLSLSNYRLPEGVEVYLEDNLEQKTVLLNQQEYTFTPAKPLTNTGRFFLHISKKTLNTPDKELSGLQIYTSTADKALYVKGLIKETATLKLYDIQGRMISQTQIQGNTNSTRLDLGHLSSGVYVVELKNNSIAQTQKVILK